MAHDKLAAARRLRIARKLNNITQPVLARRIGYSVIYIQKIEGASSPMTKAFAQKVATVTGISWNWLLGHTGKDSVPVDGLGVPYDPKLFDSRRHLHADIDPDGFASGQIHRLCHYLTTVLIGAYRKGHYAFMSESVRDLLKRTSEKLKLNANGGDSVCSQLERYIFSGHEYSADPGLRESQWRLLSPIGIMKWADALNGTSTDRQYLLAELNSLFDLVASSFVARSESNADSKGERALPHSAT